MAKRTEWNTTGLSQYAEQRRAEAESKVQVAIDELKRKHKQINFKTVAEESGVSKATLYKNKRLRTRIESLRAVKKSPAQQHEIENRKRSQERDLRQQIEVLKEEKEMLIIQLVEMDRIIQENQHLKKLLASKMRE